ncbi:MAG: peptidoglycan-binding domain-containing protein [Cyanobacteriota bacterium]|nr:peptidoglycan-binding domain-containing protein [Cyanobacteriota bacterium]
MKNIPEISSSCGLGQKLVLMAALLLLAMGGATNKAIAQKLWESGDEVMRIQFRLQSLGYSYVDATGVYDLNTQQAVMDFQQRRGLEVDGVVGRQTRPVLFGTFDPMFGTSENFNTLSSFPSNPQNPRLFPPEGATFPSSSFPTPAIDLNPIPVAASRVTRAAGSLQFGDRGEEVRALQVRLRQQGYYSGNIDGYYGEETQRAVAQFQTAIGLFPDGIAGERTLAALGLPPIEEAREGAYVVVVPGGQQMLLKVRVHIRDAELERSGRGVFVNAGQFGNRNEAESLSYSLRAEGFDARVSYNP